MTHINPPKQSAATAASRYTSKRQMRDPTVLRSSTVHTVMCVTLTNMKVMPGGGGGESCGAECGDSLVGRRLRGGSVARGAMRAFICMDSARGELVPLAPQEPLQIPTKTPSKSRAGSLSRLASTQKRAVRACNDSEAAARLTAPLPMLGRWKWGQRLHARPPVLQPANVADQPPVGVAVHARLTPTHAPLREEPGSHRGLGS